MKAAIEFQAESRDEYGKGAARTLRRAARVPGIIYGTGKEATSFSLEEKIIKREYLKGGFFNKIVSITVGKDTRFALPKELQFHPVTDQIEHVDFLELEENTEVRVQVPVRFLNLETCVGIKRGGNLNVVRHALELWAKPADIPARIEVDIEEAKIGDSIHLAHITLPENVRSVIERDFTIATIAGRGAKDDEDETTTATAVEGEAAEGEAAAE